KPPLKSVNAEFSGQEDAAETQDSGRNRQNSVLECVKAAHIPSVSCFFLCTVLQPDTIMGHGGREYVVTREDAAACPDTPRSLFRVVRRSYSPCAVRSTLPTPLNCARHCCTPPTGPSASV